MLTSSSTAAVKRRVVENVLVCQSSAVVAVDQCCKCPNGAVCRQFIDPLWKAVRFDEFLSRCFSHKLKFPPKKPIRLSGTNPEHVGIGLFPSTCLSFYAWRSGSNKLRRVEVFSDQSEQDARPVVTVLCSKQFWEQEDVGTRKLQRRKNSGAWQTNIFLMGV